MSYTFSTKTYTSTNTGISTILAANGNPGWNPRVIAVNGNYIFIVNYVTYNTNSSVFYSTDAGSTWNNTTPSPNYTDTMWSCSVSKDGKVLITGAMSNRCFYSSNVGKTFVELSPPTGGKNVGVISDDGSTIYIARCGPGSYDNTSNNIYRSKTSINPNTWTKVFGTNVPLYNSENYATYNFTENNASLTTNSDGTYVIGTPQFKPLLGINDVWSKPIGVFEGWWDSTAISNTGQFMAFTNLSSGMWCSTNYGKTFSRPFTIGITHVTIDKVDGKFIFCYGDNTGSRFTIYYSSNSGATFSTLTSGRAFINMNYNSSNYTLYVLYGDNTITAYTFPYSKPTVTIDGTPVALGGTYTAIARTKSVNLSVTSTSALFPILSALGTTSVLEDLNTITITDNLFNYNVYVMVLRNCFKEDTKILCYVDNKEQYIPVQELRRGTLVKTQLNGYVPVHVIGHSKIYNSDNKLRHLNRLFKCTKENYPEITEDLIITGCHGILVDKTVFTDELRQKTKELTRDDEWVTDDKFRLLTCLDERAEPYEEEGTFPIWHFALDHFDKYMNYGVYANGLLVETCDIYNMEEHSGLELV
jgi:hypothetical protein